MAERVLSYFSMSFPKQTIQEAWKALWMSLVGGAIGILILSVVLPDQAFLHTLDCDTARSVDAIQVEDHQAICFLSPDAIGRR